MTEIGVQTYDTEDHLNSRNTLKSEYYDPTHVGLVGLPPANMPQNVLPEEPVHIYGNSPLPKPRAVAPKVAHTQPAHTNRREPNAVLSVNRHTQYGYDTVAESVTVDIRDSPGPEHDPESQKLPDMPARTRETPQRKSNRATPGWPHWPKIAAGLLAGMVVLGAAFGLLLVLHAVRIQCTTTITTTNDVESNNKHTQSTPYVNASSAGARDCLELYKNGERTSGIYKITPTLGASFDVWCDMGIQTGGRTQAKGRHVCTTKCTAA